MPSFSSCEENYFGALYAMQYNVNLYPRTCKVTSKAFFSSFKKAFFFNLPMLNFLSSVNGLPPERNWEFITNLRKVKATKDRDRKKRGIYDMTMSLNVYTQCGTSFYPPCLLVGKFTLFHFSLGYIWSTLSLMWWSYLNCQSTGLNINNLWCSFLSEK